MAVQHPELVRGVPVNEAGLNSIVTDPEDRKVLSEFRLSLVCGKISVSTIVKRIGLPQ